MPPRTRPARHQPLATSALAFTAASYERMSLVSNVVEQIGGELRIDRGDKNGRRGFAVFFLPTDRNLGREVER